MVHPPSQKKKKKKLVHLMGNVLTKGAEFQQAGQMILVLASWFIVSFQRRAYIELIRSASTLNFTRVLEM